MHLQGTDGDDVRKLKAQDPVQMDGDDDQDDDDHKSDASPEQTVCTLRQPPTSRNSVHSPIPPPVLLMYQDPSAVRPDNHSVYRWKSMTCRARLTKSDRFSV